MIVPRIKCPICGKVLLYNIYEDEFGNACIGNLEDGVCVLKESCEHYKWEPIGNACYECPDCYDICEPVKNLIARAKHTVFDGTTVWLLIPVGHNLDPEYI